MKWIVNHQLQSKSRAARIDELINALMLDRGLNTSKLVEAYINPKNPMNLSLGEAGLKTASVKRAVSIIRQAIDKEQPIIVYGDYDADGITATGILWEALASIGAKAIPFIPQRDKHGYGLSVSGLEEVLNSIGKDKLPLVVTVDNGIVAHVAAEYLAEKGVPLIITDHHQPTKTLPQCEVLVHSDRISGAGVAWLLAREVSLESAKKSLDLVTIGTVTDLLPLKDLNRSIVKHGLIALQQTKRPGLRALYKEAGINSTNELSTYHIGYVIGPRLNAMGRLEDAADSLRLLCTKNAGRARRLAHKLSETNKNRQDLTHELTILAHDLIDKTNINPILIVEHESFHEGIIGLIAGKLSQHYYRPTIVLSAGGAVSKASARSIKGVNIIELIRTQEELLINAGGHPLAAGFTIETERIDLFKEEINKYALKNIDESLFDPVLDIDAGIDIDDVTDELYEALEQLKPFGISNHQPVFCSVVRVVDARQVGVQNNHLKLVVQSDSGKSLDAIGFGLGGKYALAIQTSKIKIAYAIESNTWNGRTSLQMRILDIKRQENNENQ